MKHLPPLLAVLALSGLVAASACEQAGSGGGGSKGAAATTTGASATGGCGGTTEAFGACNGTTLLDGGTAAPGAECQTDSDCKPACCPCPRGNTMYTYAACTCGRCTSVCDPSNDYRAPVCLDGGGVVPVGCFSCGQILNEALADGDQYGPLACTGAATTQWGALSGCATASCSGACPGGIMPSSACVACIEAPDGGCATELAGCDTN